MIAIRNAVRFDAGVPVRGLPRLCLAAVVAALVLTGPALAQQNPASGTAELIRALRTARGGETVTLAPGSYGDVALRGLHFDPPVVLRADPPGSAVLDSLAVTGTSGLRVEGLTIAFPDNGPHRQPVVLLEDSDDITLRGLEVHGPVDDDYSGLFGIMVQRGSGLRLEGNRVHDVRFGIALFGAQEAVVAGNHLEQIGEDVFKFANVSGVLIENNIGPLWMHPAEGAHDDFMQFQGPPSRRVTVRGNLFLPQYTTHAQGIFFGGEGGHEDVLIEQNIIATSVPRAISVNSGTRITVRDNTVIGLKGKHGLLARLYMPEGAVVERNIWAGSQKDRKRNDSNLLVDAGRGDAYAPLFDIDPWNSPPRLVDLVPRPGSPAETLGAAQRLRTILATQP